MSDTIETTLSGHFSRNDRNRAHFHLLPFRVPRGVSRLSVRYGFEHRIPSDQAGWQAGNILDIGLFDARGADFLSGAGFRGWSGSTRESFFVSPTDATPGYLPGPIIAGEWQVALGLYQIAQEGCDYTVVLTMDQGDSMPTQPAPPDALTRSPAEGNWLRGDLHAHTWHSDGTGSLEDLLVSARSQGLDFCAVTEHNTISHLEAIQRAPSQGPLLIPGVEISTYRGHANVWPVDGFVEFRCQSAAEMAAVRESVRHRGALFSVNHPKAGGPPWEFDQLFEPDCIEIWGGPWFISNYQSLAVWDEQLRRGKRVTAVGGSDKHVGPYAGSVSWYDLGTPCTWVRASECSTAAIVDALSHGRAFVSASPTGPCVDLSASLPDAPPVGIGGEVRVPRGAVVRLAAKVVGADGMMLRLVSADQVLAAPIEGDSFASSWDVAVEKPGYWRAEVIEPPEIPLEEEPAALLALALSNPVYVTLA